MPDYAISLEAKTKQKVLRTNIKGKALLSIPQINKGTAFSHQERLDFELLGKLPPRIETLEEQVERAYTQYKAYNTDLQRNIYLNNLNDKNQTLFFKLVTEYLDEILPYIYTPSVGTAVRYFSQEFRQPRGMFISYDDRSHIRSILATRTNRDVDIIVITDGEGVLGIGDQGVGGIDIPVAKCMLYTLFGGINPIRTLPIHLDVGTNNQTLLDDPYYLGRREKRLDFAEYDVFIAELIAIIQQQFPRAFIHWEDLGRRNAYHILNEYSDKICHFNDDIQGTGVVTLAALFAAVKSKDEILSEQRILIYGAGSAGMGIAQQLCGAMVREGTSLVDARNKFWLYDRPGLLLTETNGLTPMQEKYAREASEVSDWDLPADLVTLHRVIQHVKPTILVGCSTVSGAFNELVIKAMCQHTEKPIIFPLSNPTECAEATPEQIISYSQGKAIIATGSPFPPVRYKEKDYIIAQNNNALAFPGIGLGIVATRATRLTDNMLWVACNAIRDCAPILEDINTPPLPPLTQGKAVGRKVALAVAKQAFLDNVAGIPNTNDLEQLIDDVYWEPSYLPYLLKD